MDVVEYTLLKRLLKRWATAKVLGALNDIDDYTLSFLDEKMLYDIDFMNSEPDNITLALAKMMLLDMVNVIE